MNIVEKTLLENMENPSSLFIFPTDIAASRWADRLLRLRRGGSIPMDKFIAWDAFKQNSISSRVKDKKSVPSVLRKMFISALVRENSELCSSGKKPVFESLIKPEWAQQADSHVNWLTGILPQLGIWLKQIKDFSSGDDRDLLTLTEHYRQFLDKYGLFEPAWETPPFEDTGKECFIFFSESLADFCEYKELLEKSSHVKIIDPIISEEEEKNREVFFYTNSRSEITEAALYIQALHDNKNITWDSICVSIPDEKYYSSYLTRELENRNIPYIRQSGAPLNSCQAGKFFAALAGCVSQDYSFASLTELLLNPHLPWKQSGEIKNLIDFGIKNNCIGSWAEEENGKETLINVWEDAFTHPYGGIDPETRKFFGELKTHANALYNAPSFSEIRKQYFIFRTRFLDMDKVLGDADTILSRCISELMYLTEIEKSFPEINVPDPFRFFTGYLEEINYLAQQVSSGVAILPYRTAAPSPFDCHIILGASQEALTTVFTPLAFLPGSKREKLGILERDASKTFITLHQYNSRLPAAFFCSEDTFSGYAIPHSALGAAPKPKQRYDSEPLPGGKFSPDLYRAESAFLSSVCAAAKPDILPGRIHKNQKSGFEQWLSRRKAAAGTGPAISADNPLLHMIRKRFSGRDELKDMLSVSSSSLAPYFECPHKWIFNRVLELENEEIETSLMASNISGQVYHSCLSLFLNEIKESKMRITLPVNSGTKEKPVYRLPELYINMLKKNIEKVFASFPMLPESRYQEMSMLTARLLLAQKEMFFLNLEKFLLVFISFFSDFRVIAAESKYQLFKNFYFLTGIVDCILEERSGARFIVDFKTKSIPALSSYTGEEGLADFQLPMYLRLAEADSKKEVQNALFFSIIDAAPVVLFGSIKDITSDESIPKKEVQINYGSDVYKSIMNEFDEKAEQFAREISEGTFSVRPLGSANCVKCSYSNVCRTMYKICHGEQDGN